MSSSSTAAFGNPQRTPALSPNRSDSQNSVRSLPHDEVYKISMRNVHVGATKEQLMLLLERKLGQWVRYDHPTMHTVHRQRHVYVKFYREDYAERAVRNLNGFLFMGKRLQVQREDDVSRELSGRGRSNTGTTSSASVSTGPVIVDGSNTE